jgi:N6-adenosine-specific RNA methylase IME4
MTVTPLVALSDITVPPDRMRQLRPKVVDELAESISERGLLHSITLRPRPRKGYLLVAGRHRLEAVRKLGQDTIRAEVCEGLDADAALLAQIDENLIRADLSPAERAMHIGRRKELYEKLHPETKPTKAGGPGRAKTRRQNGNDTAERFTKDAAKKTGKPERTIQRDASRAKIAALGDVVGTALDEGAELDALAKLPEAAQRDLIERAKAGERVTAKHVLKKLRRETREQELADATEAASQALGCKVYGLIYADPAWRFELWAESGKDRVADNHYPTMTTDQIAALPVPAANDSVLFLWATPMMLPEAIEVMRSWGFTYKSLITWVKDRDGLGYWVRNRVELLLIGTRGNVPAPTPGEQPPQVIEAPRGRHSEKPEIFAEIIGRMFPSTPKLEMFARDARPGWNAWGNEAPPNTVAS